MIDSKRPWLVSIGDPADQETTDSKHVTETNDAEQDSGNAKASSLGGDTSSDQLPDDTLGLAISGGGIRSAAFSLGVIQAFARTNWLRYVDYFSTVSGGGYTGSFVGRLFDQCVKTDGIAGAFGDVNPGAAQDRVRQELADSASSTIHWLRSHANYLSPTGFGETLFNFATFWRNFLSIYFVVGFFFFAIFGAVNLLTYSEWLTNTIGSGSSLASQITPLQSWLPDWAATPWTALVELVFWLAVVPLSFAYWLVSQDHHRRFVIPFLIACVLISIGALIATGQPVALAVFTASIAWTYASWFAIDKREGHGSFDGTWRTALARNYLTHRLVFWVSTGILFAAFALIDVLGMRLAREHLMGQLSLSSILGYVSVIAGFVTVAAPVVRLFATYLATDGGQSKGVLATIASIPYLPTFLVLIVGVFLPLLLISFVTHVVFQIGYAYFLGLAATLLAGLVTLLLGGKTAVAIVNRSGPLTIYTARLARVFLGAVNPNRRRRDDGMDVSHVIEGDDVPLCDYRPHAAGGPLHLFNVAVNQTVDFDSRRGLRDRQTDNMAVGPVGINLSTTWHGTWTKQQSESDNIVPLTDGAEIPHPFLSTAGGAVPVEPLGVRNWMAISGAAISPGLGRHTSTAVSLVTTLANARLGYWWDTGLYPSQRAGIALRLSWSDRAILFLRRFLQAQSLLMRELRGRFPGPWDRHWYLTDGGHFENSGLYEMIRRRVPYMILCGAGQDRKQEASDIAELTRMARIDFGAEIQDATKIYTDLGKIGVPDDVKDSIGSLESVLAVDTTFSAKHAALFRVTFDDRNDAESWNGRCVCWILYLKASLSGDESSDVLNYAKTHPDFPNESTLDQFFDERQWESYRKLGDHIGTKILDDVTASKVPE